MSALILRKLLRALLTVLLLVTTVFFVLRVTGDPAMMLIGEDAPAEALEEFRRNWGLDAPLWSQYLSYIRNLLNGEFGRSFLGDRTALAAVLERLPQTLWLMGLAMVFALLVGIPAGIYAAIHRDSWIDRLLMLGATIGFSVPNFVVGIFLILVFGAIWQLLPTTGSETAWHYILPVATLGSADTAIFARFTRSAMLETLGQPFMRTALAKGVPWRRAVLRHALPNAAIGLMTIFGLYIGRMISGAVVTENVFAWPGIGSLLVLSVENRDFAVVQTIVILVGVTMVCANLLVDLSYLRLDPRLRDVQQR